MPKITLLPFWTDHNFDLGFHDTDLTKEAWPKDWHPTRVEDLQSYAFPTPYAEAERICAWTRLAEGRGLPARYRNLVLGLTLGHLTLEMLDLDVADDFGRALLNIEPDIFLGLLWRPIPGETAPRLFGATHPRAFVWPHARANTFAPAWDKLDETIASDPDYPKALQLLAEFRKALDNNGLWKDTIPWMLGLKKMLPDDVAPSDDLRLLRRHCRFVGPISLAVAGKNEPELIYWPVYHENFAKDFLHATTSTFVKNEKANVVELQNKSPRQETWVTIKLPNVKSEKLRAAGVGVVDKLGPADWGSRADVFHLNDRTTTGKRTEGLFSLLKSVYTAFEGLLDVSRILKYFFYYPDPVRLLVDRLGPYGLPRDHQVSFSPEFTEQIIEADQGVPDTSKFDGDDHAPAGCQITLTPDSQTKLDVIYVEKLDAADVGDLRALGLVLWEVYVGEAIINRNLIQSYSDDRPSQDIIDMAADRPISAKPEYYQRIRDVKFQERLGRRLATLQRFVRSYAQPPAKMATDHPSIARLVRRAADAFAMWVNPLVIENGSPAVSWQSIGLPGGAKIFVAIDILQGEQS
jgi:hypothetical protein